METKDQRKLRLLKELQELEMVEAEDVEDLEILRGKGDAEQKEKNETISGNKKPRTEAQMKTFEKARETARVNAEKRKAERDVRAEEERKLMEEKIVKKAISLKKKQIKQQAVLDEISDDDTPIEKIKDIVKKLPPKKKDEIAVEKKEPPKYRFF